MGLDCFGRARCSASAQVGHVGGFRAVPNGLGRGETPCIHQMRSTIAVAVQWPLCP